MHGSPGRTGTLLEGQRGGVDGSSWNYRVLRCVGWPVCLVTEPARASEGSEEDREQEEYLTEWRRKHEKEIKKQWA